MKNQRYVKLHKGVEVMGKYAVVDLFAGAGGLSLGFVQTQKYDIKVAFENNPDMQATYRKNHPSTDVLGDVCQANYKEIREKYGEIDVVIGGPPCQGFSNANRQKNSAINMNNMLVKQYIRAILELQPKAFVMENVSMLRSEVHRFYLTRTDIKIVEKYRIPTKETALQLLDKAYVFDGAIEIVKNKALVQKYLWDEKHYFELNVIYKSLKNSKKLVEALNKHRAKLLDIAKEHVGETNNQILRADHNAFSSIVSYFERDGKIDELKFNIPRAIMYQRMLNKAKEIFDNDLIVERYDKYESISAVIKSYAVFDYLKAILESPKHGYVINSSVLCAADYGAPQKRMRFVVMGVKKKISSKIALPKGTFDEDEYYTVRDAIEDLSQVDTITEVVDDVGVTLGKVKMGALGTLLRDSKVLYNHIVTKTTDVALQRFKALKQGQNFHSLDEALKTNTYTDASRTQNTIYLRLDYDEPSGTVVNVRKSMWIHPTLDRAISVREAARLQTFPDSFVFCGTKDKQYQQVGNAVPPIMAKAVAEKLYSILNNSKGSDEYGESTSK